MFEVILEAVVNGLAGVRGRGSLEGRDTSRYWFLGLIVCMLVLAVVLWQVFRKHAA